MVIFLLGIFSCTQSDELLNHPEVLSVTRLNKRIKQIFYKSDGLKIEGYITYPDDFNNDIKYPFIIDNRGGNRTFGEYNLSWLKKHHYSLSSNNYIVFTSQLRGSTNSEGVDKFGGSDLNDSIMLYKLAKKLSYVDASRAYNIG